MPTPSPARTEIGARHPQPPGQRRQHLARPYRVERAPAHLIDSTTHHHKGLTTMHTQRSIFPALTLLAMALAATQAQAATAGACEGNPVGGTAEISVDVRAQPLALPRRGRYEYDYSASQIGRASCRESVWQYGEISGGTE